jgi:general secretion pathway protein H
LPGRTGFTLIELMVVLLIIGLFAGLVSAVVRPGGRDLLRLEAERLAQLLELAAEESQLTGTPIGWTSDGPGYRFWRFHESLGWIEIRDSDLLRPRTLPEGMAIAALRVESMRPQGAMRLEFIPYAPTLAFTIDMAFGAERSAIAASPIGRVQVVQAPANRHGDLATH